MKMYHLPFGDWSGDGHREYKIVPVMCEDKDTFKKAENKIKEKYGEYFFSYMADDFEDATIGEEIWKAVLEDTNYTIDNFLDDIDDTYRTEGITTLEQAVKELSNEPMPIKVVIGMYLALVRAFGAEFEVVPDVEMICNVAAPGYGCFGY